MPFQKAVKKSAKTEKEHRSREIPTNKYSKNTACFFFFQSKTFYVNHALSFLFVAVFFQMFVDGY